MVCSGVKKGTEDPRWEKYWEGTEVAGAWHKQGTERKPGSWCIVSLRTGMAGMRVSGNRSQVSWCLLGLTRPKLEPGYTGKLARICAWKSYCPRAGSSRLRAEAGRPAKSYWSNPDTWGWCYDGGTVGNEKDQPQTHCTLEQRDFDGDQTGNPTDH